MKKIIIILIFNILRCSYSYANVNQESKEIAKKVNKDFDKKKLPLMLGMINAIVEDKKLDLNWELFS